MLECANGKALKGIKGREVAPWLGHLGLLIGAYPEEKQPSLSL